MPYAANADLPKAVRDKLEPDQQAVWRAVFNSVHEKTGDEAAAAKAAWSKVAKGDSMEDVDFGLEFDFAKKNEDERLVFGWLSVAKDKDGITLVDRQDDIIEPVDLEKAAYDFVLNARVATESHERKVGKLVESCMFTKEKQEALGIPDGVMPEGWWVGYYIEDDQAWDKVKSGELTAYSIGGKGKRKEV